MGLFDWLFGKKKSTVSQKADGSNIGADDGQSKYFKDEPKPEAKPTENAGAVKKETSAAKAKGDAEKPTAKATAKADEPKPEASASPKVKKPAAKPAVKADAPAAKSTLAEKPKASGAKSEKPEAKSAKKSVKLGEKPAVAAEKTDDKSAKAASKAANQSMPKEPKQARTGRFEIKKTRDDRFVFNLYAPNSVIVATSQVYSSSQSAVNGIESIIANAGRSPIEDQTVKSYAVKPYPKWELYLDNAGQYRFRLNAPNGNCIVHSQGYTTKASCKNGIESIIRCSVNPEIDKSYLKKDK